MFNNIKFPTLIISSPRTGSTILGDNISVENNNMKYFSEPHLNDKHFHEFLDYSSQSIDYILKIHAQDIKYYTLNLTDFYLIRLRRKNIVDQIASYYVAHTRKKFGAYDPDSIEYNNYQNSTIQYNFKILKMCIDSMISFNEHLQIFDKQFNITFDHDLWYEDLNLDTDNDQKYRVHKTAYPKNYHTLKSIITHILDNKSSI